MKTYEGNRIGGGLTVTVFYSESVEPRPLDPIPSQKIWNHSPDGFEWGYGGSGPAQLALAILLDVTGDKHIAVRHYQKFKQDVIAKLPQDEWKITASEVVNWLTDNE